MKKDTTINKSASFLKQRPIGSMVWSSISVLALFSVVSGANAQVPQSPSAEYSIKNITADKTVAVDNPIKMTETYNQRVQDRQKSANARQVSAINAGGKGGTVVTLSNPNGAPVNKLSVVDNASTANSNNTNNSASADKNEKKAVKEAPKVKLVTEAEITEKMNSTSHNIKELGRVNSRLEYITQLQKLKQAEFDLLQPPEDKAAKERELAAKEATPQTPYSPVGNVNIPAPMPKVEMVASNTNTGPDFSNVQVYTIIGFDGQYSAKVSLDGQSTYTVSKGDTLPNGSIVTDVTRYYITVAERSAVGRPLSEPQRIYATGKPLPGSVNLTPNNPTPSAAPSAMPSSPVGGLIVPSRR